MKKFLSKKPVMLAFIIAAVAFLAIYIGMLVRPISYGMTYKSTTNIAGVDTVTTIKIKSDKKAVVKMEAGSTKIEYEAWIYRDGYKFTVLDNIKDMSKDEYKEAVKQLEELKREDKATYNEMMTKINAFKCEVDEDIEAKCAGAVVFTVIGGVIELALLSFAALTIVFRKK